MTDAERIERNLLAVYEVFYPAAVEKVATALRPRFESGELRGWISGDADRYSGRRLDPLTKIEFECERRWVTTPVRALGALAMSPNKTGTSADEWVWNATDLSCTLRGAASIAMARDVLAFARERGWSKPQKGEEPAFKAQRQARRAA
jgi:hypothetical protein